MKMTFGDPKLTQNNRAGASQEKSLTSKWSSRLVTRRRYDTTRAWLKSIIVFLIFLLANISTVYAKTLITYKGLITKPDGSPLSSNSVSFRFQIKLPAPSNCLLYEESKVIDFQETNGQFAITLNDGTGALLSGSFGLDEALSNRHQFVLSHPNMLCTGFASYTPSKTDNRNVVLMFREAGSTNWESIGPTVIAAVPYAVEAKNLGGYSADDLLRFDRTNPSTQTVSALPFSDFQKLTNLLSGTSNAYQKAGELNGAIVTTPSVSGQVLAWNGTSWAGVTPLTSETDPNVQAFAKTSVADCTTGKVLSMQSGVLVCVTDSTTNFSAQPIKTFLAGPASGTDAVPAFRTIASSDLPTAITDAAWTASSGHVYRTSGSVGVGTSTPQAALDVVNSTPGTSSILAPRDTTSNRPSPGINGMLRYNSTTHAFEGFSKGIWQSFGNKLTYAQNVDPGIANDESQGYSVGSYGINTSTGNSFICKSAAVGSAVWEPLASADHPGYLAGNSYLFLNNFQSVSGAVLTSGSMYCTIGRIPSKVTINALLSRVTTAASTNFTYYVALYSHEPTLIRPSKLLESVSGNASATGVYTHSLTTPRQLSPGFYWTCIQANDSAVRIYSVGSTGITAVSGGQTLGSTTPASLFNQTGSNITGVVTTGTFGTLPADLASATWADNSANNSPIIGFRVLSSP